MVYQDIFHDEFWDGQDIMVNALDNIKARLSVVCFFLFFSFLFFSFGHNCGCMTPPLASLRVCGVAGMSTPSACST